MEDQLMLLAEGGAPFAIVCATLLLLARMFKDDIGAWIRGDRSNTKDSGDQRD